MWTLRTSYNSRLRMLGLKISLLLGGLALVAGRILTAQKTSLSLTDTDEGAEVLNAILLNFFEKPDVISGEQYGDIVQGCSKGKCNFCKKIVKFEACFVATLEKDSIEFEVTLANKVIAKIVAKVPNPPALCKKTIPLIPLVKDVCVQVKDINLKNASGCVYISLKIGFKKIQVKIACFKIPTIDGDERGELADQESRTYQDETVLVFEPIESNS